LDCGTILTYDYPTFAPADGEIVPCRRHGYCHVNGPRVRNKTHKTGTARARPSVAELIDFMSGGRTMKLYELRRHGFTLRIVVEAQERGLVELDLLSGWVSPIRR
jgi:hypothetical protein